MVLLKDSHVCGSVCKPTVGGWAAIRHQFYGMCLFGPMLWNAKYLLFPIYVVWPNKWSMIRNNIIDENNL